MFFRSIVPKWEELLIFNEAPEILLKPTTLFLFEVIDLLSFSLADCQYAQFGSESAWHHIAWAFLKIMNEHSHSNLNEKLRLQLFQPKHRTLSQSKSKLPHVSVFVFVRSYCRQFKESIESLVLKQPSFINNLIKLLIWMQRKRSAVYLLSKIFQSFQILVKMKIFY